MFTINNIITMRAAKPAPMFDQRSDWMTLGGDCMIAVTLLFIGIMAASGNFTHFGVGSMTNPVAMGTIISAASLILINGGTTVMRIIYLPKAMEQNAEKCSKAVPEESLATIPQKITVLVQEEPVFLNREQIITAIRSATIPDDFSQVYASKNISAQLILNGLHLGRDYGFVESTFLENIHRLREDNSSRTYVMDTSNKNHFNAVITACPIYQVDPDCPGFENYEEEAIRASMAGHQVEWVYVGRVAGDDTAYLPILIHDCTYPDSELAKKYKMGRGIGYSVEQMTAIVEEKKAAVPEDYRLYFEAIFKVMDRAVFGQEKVFVHCQKGVSRSATLVAAYLINRFQVNAKEAVRFLQSKRRCVAPNSGFMDFLEEYAQKLTEARTL